MLKQTIFGIFMSTFAVFAAEPEWLGNTIGTEHTAPVPFEALKVKEHNVEIWGRKFTFNDAALLEQVVSQNEEMLTSPVVLSYELGNETKILSPVSGSLKQLEAYDDYAVFEGKASDGILTCKIRSEIHFDGFMKISFKTESANNFKVKRLSMIFPFRPDVIGPHYVQQFMGYSPDLIRATWGQAVKERNFAYTNFLSLAGHNVSFTFISECPDNWFLQRKSKAIQILPSEDSFALRVNFIDVFGSAKVGDRDIEIGMLFGPSRPPLKDFRKYTVSWWEPKPVKTKAIAEMGMKPLVLQYPFSLKGKSYQHHAGTDYGRAARVCFNFPEPENKLAFKEWLKETADGGGIVCPYINADDFDSLSSPGKEYFKEWAGDPENTAIAMGPSGFSPECGFMVCRNAKSWDDYFVYKAVSLAKEYKFGGYYIDNCAARVCMNTAHGVKCKPYIDEAGKAWSRNPIFAARTTYLRLYRAMKAINPEFVFFVNGGEYYPFWEFSMSAEYLTRIAGAEQLWPEFVSPGDMEGMFFRGQPYGPIKFIYPAYSGKNITHEATRAMLSLLLHGDSAYQLSLCDTKEIENYFSIALKYGVPDAKFIPYWRNNIATCSEKDILISLYCSNQIALVIISNPWDENKTVAISLSSYEIFPGYNGEVSVENAETGETIKVNSGMFFDKRTDVIKVPVKKSDYTILIIKKQIKN